VERDDRRSARRKPRDEAVADFAFGAGDQNDGFTHTVTARPRPSRYGSDCSRPSCFAVSNRFSDVYVTTPMTSQRIASSFSETTRNAAIRTAGTPPSARPQAACVSYVRERTKRTHATGMRNAHEPIIIGNAAVGFIPSRLTRIMHGP